MWQRVTGAGSVWLPEGLTSRVAGERGLWGAWETGGVCVWLCVWGWRCPWELGSGVLAQKAF